MISASDLHRLKSTLSYPNTLGHITTGDLNIYKQAVHNTNIQKLSFSFRKKVGVLSSYNSDTKIDNG